MRGPSWISDRVSSQPAFFPSRRRGAAPYTPRQILGWIDDWHERTGSWPKRDSGVIPGSLGETWNKVSTALRVGLRGLPGGSSLARFLEERRGVRNEKHLPPYTVAGIVGWARHHHRVHGRWPTEQSGPILAAAGETALHAHEGFAWSVVRSAIGRLRGLYLDQARRSSFSTGLVTVLRRVVASYPFLRHVRPMKQAAACRNGGRDPRADHGYTPQHRARFRSLFH
jgi:hypothetical protein